MHPIEKLTHRLIHFRRVLVLLFTLGPFTHPARASMWFYSSIDEDKLIAKAIRKKRPSLCENAPVDSTTLSKPRDFCYMQVALGLDDPEVCRNIVRKDPVGSADVCIGKIALNRAIRNKNMSPCSEVPASFERAKCFSDYAAKALEPLACENIPDTDGELHDVRGYCFYRVGIYLKDTELCKKSNNEGECLGSVAAQANDPGICSKSTSLTNATKCFTAFAFAKKDARPCENILNVEDKLWCYMRAEKQTVEQCGQSQDPIRKMDCYKRVAIRDDNIDVCEKIKDVQIPYDPSVVTSEYNRCIKEFAYKEERKKFHDQQVLAQGDPKPANPPAKLPKFLFTAKGGTTDGKSSAIFGVHLIQADGVDHEAIVFFGDGDKDAIAHWSPTMFSEEITHDYEKPGEYEAVLVLVPQGPNLKQVAKRARSPQDLPGAVSIGRIKVIVSPDGQISIPEVPLSHMGK